MSSLWHREKVINIKSWTNRGWTLWRLTPNPARPRLCNIIVSSVRTSSLPWCHLLWHIWSWRRLFQVLLSGCLFPASRPLKLSKGLLLLQTSLGLTVVQQWMRLSGTDGLGRVSWGLRDWYQLQIKVTPVLIHHQRSIPLGGKIKTVPQFQLLITRFSMIETLWENWGCVVR